MLEPMHDANPSGASPYFVYTGNIARDLAIGRRMPKAER